MSSRISFLLSLLSFSLLLYATVASDPPLAIRCSSSNTLRPGDAFTRNLHQLMYLLSAKAPAVGFEIGSVGSGPSRAFGLALCRGDVTRALCRACIRTANAHTLRRCPRRKRATVWLDRCMVRYSDSDFFGEVDRAHSVLLSDRSNASADPSRFESKVVRLMKGLTKRAYLTPLLYAAGELVINNHKVRPINL
ncbi:Cysteine-rich repeat secretory protein 38 [Ananas comosus]|uniref:Cysteine-rich repeat secretory protein 38 n=1 Tax=Ananas comosus TaxID=4615 RepID=A0A199UGF0_ANACO|nr:Cysteine-rich repeat secretory protein 38 [Ananas comosus]